MLVVCSFSGFDDRDFNFVAAIDPDCGAEMTAVISQRFAGSSWKELGITSLHSERNGVSLPACVEKIRDPQ